MLEENAESEGRRKYFLSTVILLSDHNQVRHKVVENNLKLMFRMDLRDCQAVLYEISAILLRTLGD